MTFTLLSRKETHTMIWFFFAMLIVKCSAGCPSAASGDLFYQAAPLIECDGGHVQMANTNDPTLCAQYCLESKPDQYPTGGFIVGLSNNKCWCKEGRLNMLEPDRFYLKRSYLTRGWNGQSYSGYWTRKGTALDFNVQECKAVADPKYYSYNFLICPAGQYAHADTGCRTSKCVLCPAGQFSEADLKPPFTGRGCMNCPRGYRSRDDRAGCTACTNGEYQTFAPATFCETCEAGKYSSGYFSTSCKDCPSGFFSGTKSASCTFCPTGSALDRAVRASACTLCPSGYYEDGGCKSCPGGFVQPQSGQTQCLGCPTGMAQVSQRQTHCKECIIGYYQPQVEQLNCIQCPAGFVAEKRATACQGCQSGEYQLSPNTCTSCPAGKISPQNTASLEGCTICQPGFYSTGIACPACPPGYYSDEAGALHCTGTICYGTHV